MGSLKNTESDAASLSVSYTAASLSSTLCGLGSDSGRAIIALGGGTLGVIEGLGIEWRLRETAVRVRTMRPTLWSSKDLLDIMEYQRIHLHSDRIRKKAWDIIFVALERGGCCQILEALSVWPPAEIQLFISQLTVCASSRWTFLPVAGTQSLANRSLSRTAALTDALANLLGELVLGRPCMIDGISHDTVFMTLFDSLASFNLLEDVDLSWSTRCAAKHIDTKIKSHPTITHLCKLAIAYPLGGVRPIVDYVLRYLCPQEDHSIIPAMLRDHVDLSDAVYPPWVFLAVVNALSALAPEASSMFFHSRLLTALTDICTTTPSRCSAWGLVSSKDDDVITKTRVLCRVMLLCLKPYPCVHDDVR